MSVGTPVRVAGFLLGLAAVFAAALGVGRLAGPIDVAVAESHDMTGEQDEHAGHGEHDAMPMPAAAVSGLASTTEGYTMALARDRSQAGTRSVAFTITGPDGAPVTAYDVEHEKRLHLIAVRRDLTGFQHVHPVLDPATGVWSTRLRLTPGAWRVLADFTPTGGPASVLGTDLLVGGSSAPLPLGPDSATAEVGDYRVDLDGELVAGAETELTLRVARDGAPVTDLQPYLGAYGHLVALRDGDLGYLHVHPDGEPGEVAAGPEIVFHTEFPSAGRYRLFLDFRHDGAVRTAAFTVTVPAGHAHEEVGGHEH